MTTCVYGLGAGGMAVAFQVSINFVFRGAYGSLAHFSQGGFSRQFLRLIIGSSLIVGFLLNSFCREAAGSGIPQLKLAFWKDFGYVPWRVVWV